MKLNVDILFDHLSQHYELRRCGRNDTEILLGRPVFYQAGPLESGRVYLARREMLEPTPPADVCFLLISVGEIIDDAWRSGPVPVFSVNEDVDLLQLLNTVQAVFDFFDTWDSDLRRCVSEDAEIAVMTAISARVITSTITIIDRNIRVLGMANLDDASEAIPFEVGKMIPVEAWKKLKHPVIENYRQNAQRRRPFLHRYLGASDETLWVYSINLIVRNEFEGCATITSPNRPFLESELTLFQRLAEYVEMALYKQISLLDAQNTPLKSMIAALVESLPLEDYDVDHILQASTIDRSDDDARWIVRVIKAIGSSSMLPYEYFCDAMDRFFPNSIGMRYRSDFISLQRTSTLPTAQNPEDLENVRRFLEGLDLQMGASAPFENITDIRTYYRQASCALETGGVIGEDGVVFNFEEIMLPYMLLHCTGEFSLDSILTDGLRALREHDKQSGVCFWDTLRIYLDNEGNASQTAKDLYVHRATLLQRLAKIFELLGSRLEEPEERLLVMMLMHANAPLNRTAERRNG